MELAIATLPESDRRYQVRMRSMLSSVLVASRDAARREQLATEALAIATADGSPELLASAHLAQRLALWQLDRLDERADVAMTAVREADRTSNVQLQLTAKLFALVDLLELGRIEEHLAILQDFRQQAADAHLALFEVYGMFLEVSRLVSIGRYDDAQKLADEARATGSAVPRRERRGRVRRLRLPHRDRPRAAGLAAARHRTAGGDQAAAHVADLAPAHPRRTCPIGVPMQSNCSPSSSTPTGCGSVTTRCSCRPPPRSSRSPMPSMTRERAVPWWRR